MCHAGRKTKGRMHFLRQILPGHVPCCWKGKCFQCRQPRRSVPDDLQHEPQTTWTEESIKA
eukprot:4642070-Amphidinium_carterae.1